MRKIIAILLMIFVCAVPLTVCAEEENKPTIYDIAGGDVFVHEGTTLPYRYVLPEDYNPEQTYPLILFLHAEAERGDNNANQLRHCVDYIRIKQPQSIILAPQCSLENQWVDVPLTQGNYSVSEVPESNELQAVMALIEKIKTDFSIDSDRVSAVGVSMGGYGVWDLLMRHNESFASGVIMSGGGDPTQAEVLKKTPIYIFHGSADEVIPISAAQEMVQSIIDVRGTKARFFEILDSTHEVCYELYFGSGVIETLSKNKISDQYDIEDNLSKEELEKMDSEESSDAKNVVDAGLQKKPSKLTWFLFVGIPTIIATIGIVIVLKKVKI